jgi:hypothetical protein
MVKVFYLTTLYVQTRFFFLFYATRVWTVSAAAAAAAISSVLGLNLFILKP